MSQNIHINPEWINPKRVSYFSIRDYVAQIELSKETLLHSEETAKAFEQYLSKMKYFFGDRMESIISYWLDSGLVELEESSKLENHGFSSKELTIADLLFDRATISHSKIKRIHEFVCKRSGTNAKVVGEYRSGIASVGVFLDDHTYQPYWYGAESEDIREFMASFLNYYRTRKAGEIFSNPFIKAALVHLLFVRIHPFEDGNGRTARILQNISFTAELNGIYDSKLKISPLNISESIRRNGYYYANRLNRIFFDMDHREENNEAINRWINFNLDMYDEQIYYQKSRFPNPSSLTALENLRFHDKDAYRKEAEKMGLKKLF